jgi:hypothetical protein
MDDAIHARWAQFRDLPTHPEMSVFPDRPPRIRHQDVRATEEALHCPKCDYDLTGSRGDYCPECGIEMAYEPVTVFTAAELSLVWAAGMVLDRAGISNLIVTGSFDPIIGLFTRKTSLPHVMVPFKFYHEAVADLDAEFGRREFKPGERPAPKPATPDWACPACGERNPGGFEVCWQCSAQAPGPA